MRILIASYLMGASVGIAPGPDLMPILSQFMPPEVAMMLGTAILFLLAYSMMVGIWLRMTIQLLAILLVGSSFMENFIYATEPNLGEIWRDVVILCALLQSLMLLTSWQLRKSAILRKKVQVRRLKARISDPLTSLTAKDKETPKPAPVVRQEPPLAKPEKRRKETYRPAEFYDEPDVVNIFA